MNGWYEVKATRKDTFDGNVRAYGWIGISGGGIFDGGLFFWHRIHRNDATPDCCRFCTFAEAEAAAQRYQDHLAEWGISQHYEIHFPIRRDLLGRKRPLKRGDCEIIKSA